VRRRIPAVIAALSIAAGGYLHLQIWRGGYRYAPVKEMFLLNVGLSALVALALLIRPNRLTALAGLLLSAGSLAAFGLSRGPGLPTPHGIFTETGLNPTNVRFLGGPAAVTLLAAEALAVITCTVMLLLYRRASAEQAQPVLIPVSSVTQPPATPSWPIAQPVTASTGTTAALTPASPTVAPAPAASLHEELIEEAAARWPAFRASA